MPDPTKIFVTERTGVVNIAFSPVQFFALRMILLDYLRDPLATKQWEDVLSGATTTIEEMFEMVMNHG